MSNPVYEELLAAGNILIDEFGRDVSYQSGSTTYRDENKKWLGKVPVAPVTVKAAIFDASAADRQRWPGITFTKKALISPSDLTITPALDDAITDEGTIYAIAEVMTSGPGGTELLYTLLLTTER